MPAEIRQGCPAHRLPPAPQHGPRQEFAHLPVLGLVRNPWSYYLSWYSFQLERPHPNFLFRILSDDGQLDFEATVRNMLHLGAGSVRLDMLLRSLPSAYSNQGLNLPNFALAPIRDTRLGFYTYLYRYLYQGEPNRRSSAAWRICARSWCPCWSRWRIRRAMSMRAFIAEALPRNVSQHGDYTQYYSDALRNLVAKRDEEIIARHAYRFGD